MEWPEIRVAMDEPAMAVGLRVSCLGETDAESPFPFLQLFLSSFEPRASVRSMSGLAWRCSELEIGISRLNALSGGVAPSSPVYPQAVRRSTLAVLVSDKSSQSRTGKNKDGLHLCTLRVCALRVGGDTVKASATLPFVT
jgi:hypothetical protein